MPDTKQKILDAAEKLFSRDGFAATSLRAITAEAGVNLAAVNYHFHSKEALLGAVIERRVAPLNRRRIELLDAVEARAGAGAPALEEVVDAFVTPVVLGFAGTPFVGLLGRMNIEPGDAIKRQIGAHMREMVVRFGAAFRRALPGVPDAEIAWSVHFSVGAIAHTLAAKQMVLLISRGLCDINDAEGIRRRLIAYICGGLRAAARAKASGE